MNPSIANLKLLICQAGEDEGFIVAAAWLYILLHVLPRSESQRGFLQVFLLNQTLDLSWWIAHNVSRFRISYYILHFYPLVDFFLKRWNLTTICGWMDGWILVHLQKNLSLCIRSTEALSHPHKYRKHFWANTHQPAGSLDISSPKHPHLIHIKDTFCVTWQHPHLIQISPKW